MGDAIDDEVLHAFAVVGTPAEVGRGLRSRWGDVAGRITLYAPYQVDRAVLATVLEHALTDVAADERSRLIGAAWTVLERSGYAGFKVQLLLRETGLSARTFYRHFADKDELLLALMTDEYARVGRRIDAALSARRSPDERVVGVGARDRDGRRRPGYAAARARLFTSQPAVLRRFPTSGSRRRRARSSSRSPKRSRRAERRRLPAG